MPSPPTTATCAAHPKRSGVTTCGACGSAICRDCIVHTSVGAKCRRCTGVKAKAAAPAGRGGERAGIVARVRAGQPPGWLFPTSVVATIVIGLIVISVFDSGQARVDPVGRTAAEDYPLNRAVQVAGAGNLKVSGTFTLPVSRKPLAGVLLVPGFGTVDRNYVMSGRTPGGPADRLAQEVNVAASGATDNLYEELAGALTRENLAVLRYDKRGLGESRVAAGVAITYDDLVTDARAALKFLSERTELEGKPLVVLGYDEGAVTAMRLASTAGVKALVMVSPPGRPVADVLGDHFVRTHGPVVGNEVVTQLRSVAAGLAAGQPLPDRDTLSGHLRPVFPAGSEQYLRQVLPIDPVTEARAVKVPVLMARGAGDPNVTAADLDALRAVLPGGSEVQVVASGDHNLAAEGVRDRAALAAIVTWVTGHLGG